MTKLKDKPRCKKERRVKELGEEIEEIVEQRMKELSKYVPLRR